MSNAVSITIAQWLKQSTEKLQNVSESARLDAEVLLCSILACDRAYLFTWPEKSLDSAQLTACDEVLIRRISGEPVAYILGEKEFWSLPFFTDKNTLIPRPDTEVLVEQVLARTTPSENRILDLGTGTGAIALAIAKERPMFCVEAVDKFPEVVALAEKNRTRLDCQNVRVFQSDWYAQTQGTFQVIVSNPPYIEPDDPHLAMGDVRHEPHSALVADDQGLSDLKVIISAGFGFLSSSGFLAVEHGYQQAEIVRSIFLQAGYAGVETVQDYGGRDRVTLGYVKSASSK